MRRPQWQTALAGVGAVMLLSGAAPVRVSTPRLIRGNADHRSLTAEESIRPSVEVRVGFNRNLQLYAFSFYVGNAASANNTIAWFGVGRTGRPGGVRSPARWWGLYGDNDSLTTWACIDTITPPPDGWSSNLYRSPYMIDPGDTVHRFQMFADRVPPVLRFYAQGFDTLSESAWTPGLFEYGWTGEVSFDSAAIARSSMKGNEVRSRLVRAR